MLEIFDCISLSICAICDKPASLRPIAMYLCERCWGELPPYLSHWHPGVWFWGPYAGPVGQMVRRAKYAGDLHLLSAIGAELARQAPRLELPVQAVVPVPASWQRSFWRGADPVRELAEPVAKALKLPLLPLLRRKERPSQAGLDTEARRKNLRNAISARPGPASVLLMDDVITTGSTLQACADALLCAGVQQVYVLAACSAHGTRKN